MILIEVFWAVGSMGEAALAWLVLPTLGWRWLLAISSIPMLMVLAFWPTLPGKSFASDLGQCDFRIYSISNAHWTK